MLPAAQASLDVERDGSLRPPSPIPHPQYARSAFQGSSQPPTLPPPSPAPPSSPYTSVFAGDDGLYRLSPKQMHSRSSSPASLPPPWLETQQHTAHPHSTAPNAPNGPSESMEMAIARNGLGPSLSMERLPSNNTQHTSRPQSAMVIDPLLMEMGSRTAPTVAHRPRPRPRLPVTSLPVPVSAPPLDRNGAVTAEPNTANTAPLVLDPVPQADGDAAANSESPIPPSLPQQINTGSYETRPPTQYKQPAVPVTQRVQRGRGGLSRGRGRGRGRGRVDAATGPGAMDDLAAGEENDGETGCGDHSVEGERENGGDAGEPIAQGTGGDHGTSGEGNHDVSEDHNIVDIGLLVDECRVRAQNEGFRGRKRPIRHARKPPRADHNHDGNHALVTFTPDPTTTATAKRVRKAVTQVDGTTAPAIRTAEAIRVSQTQAQNRAAKRAAKKTKPASQPTASTSRPTASTSQPTASVSLNGDTPAEPGERLTRVRKPVTRVDGTMAPAVRTAAEIAAATTHTKRKQVGEPAVSAKRYVLQIITSSYSANRSIWYTRTKKTTGK